MPLLSKPAPIHQLWHKGICLRAFGALLACHGTDDNRIASPQTKRSEEATPLEGGTPINNPSDDLESGTADRPDEAPGLAVGERAPEFQLLDQHGETQSLADLTTTGAAALVFYRSADW